MGLFQKSSIKRATNYLTKEKYTLKKILGPAVIVMALVLMVFSASCSRVSISDILENPSQYQGKEVKISGTVTDKYWIDILGLKGGAYQIDDESGKIWVITEKEPPAKGEKTSVKGTVSTAGKIRDRSFGTVITETIEK